MDSLKIQKLKQIYKSKLLDKSKELKELLAIMPDDQGRLRETEEALQNYLHKLAGSSGMYGYDDISVAAQEAMEACIERDASSHSVALSRLQDLLEQHASG